MATNWYFTKYGLYREQKNKNAITVYNWFKRNTDWTLQAICGMLGNCSLESTLKPSAFETGAENPCGALYTIPEDIDNWSIADFWKQFYKKMPEKTGYDTGFGIVQWTPLTNLLDWAVIDICYKLGIEAKARQYWEIINKFDYYNVNGDYFANQQYATSSLYNGIDVFEYELKRIIYEYENNDSLKEWMPVNDYPVSWYDYCHNTALKANYCGRAWCRNYERASSPLEAERGAEADYYYSYLSSLPKTNNILIVAKKLPFWYNGHERSW